MVSPVSISSFPPSACSAAGLRESAPHRDAAPPLAETAVVNPARQQTDAPQTMHAKPGRTGHYPGASGASAGMRRTLAVWRNVDIPPRSTDAQADSVLGKSESPAVSTAVKSTSENLRRRRAQPASDLMAGSENERRSVSEPGQTPPAKKHT